MEIKDKYITIGQKRAETRLRHRGMKCCSYEVKIQKNKLNKKQLESLKMYFVEAKWVYNFILTQEDIFKFNYKDHKIVSRKDKNGNIIEQEIKYLPAHLYQGIHIDIKSNIKILSSLKKNNHKVGRLKFKSDCNCINIIQYNSDYKLYFEKEKIHIVGIKKDIKVSGLSQIPKNADICNAKLIKKNDDFYIKIVTFVEKKPPVITNKTIGIDFNIKNTITTSDNLIIDKISVEETERMKRIKRNIMRNKKKNSNNRNKAWMKYRKLSEKLNNRKEDISNKIVHTLLNEYDEIYIQDEMIEKWHRNKFCSKAVQNGCLGRIKAKLKLSPKTTVIDKKYPTTQTCSNCGETQKLSLNERTYSCPKCGIIIDRDLNSAINILNIGRKIKVGTERIDFKPVENQTSGRRNPVKLGSEKQEALNL